MWAAAVHENRPIDAVGRLAGDDERDGVEQPMVLLMPKMALPLVLAHRLLFQMVRSAAVGLRMLVV